MLEFSKWSVVSVVVVSSPANRWLVDKAPLMTPAADKRLAEFIYSNKGKDIMIKMGAMPVE